MKRYLLILVALLAVVAGLGLPPKVETDLWWARRQEHTPERVRAMELERELRSESWVYQRIQWRDSVSSVLQGLDPEGRGYAWEVPDRTPDTLRTRLDAGIRLHLRALEATPPEVPVGVFLLPRSTGLHPASRRDRFGVMWNRREFYVSREGEAPFCAMVEPVGRENATDIGSTLNRLVFIPRDSVSDPNSLRICGLYAKYGMPGKPMEEWLHAGGDLYGAGVNLARRSLLLLGEGSNRGPFGFMWNYRRISPTGMACLGGVASACREAFLTGRPDAFWRYRPLGDFSDAPVDSPVDYTEARWYEFGDFGPMDPYIFQYLQEEFGPERFQAFWTSDAPVPEAFAQAFGTSVEAWTMDWAQGLYGTIARGPGVPLKASFLTFLTVGLFGALSLAVGRRRG